MTAHKRPHIHPPRGVDVSAVYGYWSPLSPRSLRAGPLSPRLHIYGGTPRELLEHTTFFSMCRRAAPAAALAVWMPRQWTP
eukprot:1307914-Pyramimonas_sp.AAC.1